MWLLTRPATRRSKIYYLVVTKRRAARYLAGLHRCGDFAVFAQFADGGSEAFVKLAATDDAGTEFAPLVDIGGYFDGSLAVGVTSPDGIRQVLMVSLAFAFLVRAREWRAGVAAASESTVYKRQ